jgi:hypothetical protein
MKVFGKKVLRAIVMLVNKGKFVPVHVWKDKMIMEV